uniref:Tryptophan--tRNA ligase, cytoplasmic n=1 Tax=Pithovirus LCPAC304 TaxID=2506594 RepID=A0A481Z7D9_9VIRU|nr:MAG: tryptophanyl-tRNA synthetase [Pithovirus LCPAC304]
MSKKMTFFNLFEPNKMESFNPDSPHKGTDISSSCISDQVTEEVDYDKLQKQFGSQLIDESLIERLERVTGKPAHPFLKRGFFFSHRDLDKLLDHIEAGGDCYIYTGRGPSSSSLHIGHLIPFLFAKYLQEAFNALLVIQITDDEKFLFRDLTLEEVQRNAVENIKDILSLGFDFKKTFIFMNTGYMGSMYPTVLQVQKCITANQVKAVFGFKMGDEEESDSIGKIAFPAIEIAPCFSSCFPTYDISKRKDVMCVVPCAIDQDPFFRMARDIAPRLGYPKPVIIHSKFIPALNGMVGKMSASIQNSAIFLSDTPKQIQKKIGRAFSGGQDTAEEHRRLGGNLKVDIAYQYLRIFDLESTEEELEKVAEDYRKGTLLSGQMKKKTIDVLTDLTKRLQSARSLKVNQKFLE